MPNTLQQVDKLAAELQSLQPLKPEYQQRLDKKIRLEFNYNSNHIEGNTLTYGETELLLIFDKTSGNHELREYEEMKSHDVAFEMIKEWAADKERPLTESAVKNLHELLLVRPFWKEAITPDGQPARRLIEVGSYKKYPNSVRLQNGEIFHYASPEETPIQMGELMQWFREEEKNELHPVPLSALLHYKFVRIHPFDDGNGRISRLLMNYVLLKHNLPPVIIKSTDKKNYLFALNQADTGNIEAFIEYIAEQAMWSLNISIKAAKGESIDESGDLDKKLFLLKKKLGEDPNETVQLTYGDEALEKVINNVVVPLGKAWEEKLKSFDTLFISRRMNFSAEKINFNAEHFDEEFENLFKSFLNDQPAKNNNVRKLIIKCSPKGLRNIHNGVGLNGGEVVIDLLRNAYELSYTNGRRLYNKLYHRPLKEEEINSIVEDLGNFLYNNIEQFIEANK
jgi:Fic family protein